MKKIHFYLVLCALLPFSSRSQCVPNTSSIAFNAGPAYVSLVSNTLDDSTAFTVEAWIYPQGWANLPSDGTIYCKHSNSLGKAGYVLRAGQVGRLSCAFAGVPSAGGVPDWVEVVSDSNSIILNKWTHVAGTYDGTNLKIYIGGVLVKDSAFTGHLHPSSFAAAIGKFSDPSASFGRYWGGWIDEVRVWGRALTQAEIVANTGHHIDPTLQTGLNGYWRFNEATGTTTADETGNGNTGTLHSASWVTQVPFGSLTAPVIGWSSSGGYLFSLEPTGNQWYYNNSLLPGDTLQFLYPQQNGNYYVVVTNADGCTASSTPYTITTVGMEKIDDSGSGFKLWPNPAKGSLSLEFMAEPSFGNSLQVISSEGRLVKDMPLEAGLLRHMIDIHDLSPGIYTVSVTGSSIRAVRRLVVE
jgi:hypothetical protein